MDYAVGRVGRIFLARIDHDENPVEEIRKLAVREKIRQATITLLGATGSARFVSGPKERKLPPEIIWTELDDVTEVLGIGNILWENEEPKIHLHTGFGNKKETKLGCLREEARTYIVIEAMIIEMTGFNAERRHNKRLGTSPITFQPE